MSKPRIANSVRECKSPVPTSNATSKIHNSLLPEGFHQVISTKSYSKTDFNYFVFLEFLLNHLHSNHKHRRYNGDNLDLTMVVPQVEIVTEIRRSNTKIDLSLNDLRPTGNGHQMVQTQTWPFVEIFAHKRYFYLEAQSFTIDGHPEIFLWLWFLGNYAII